MVFSVFGKKSRGFTLIELLVVITIIGILSSTVVVSVGSIRGKARDAKRSSDLREIFLALELANYDSDKYLQNAGSDIPSKIPCSNENCTGTGDGKYLAAVPLDPSGGKYKWMNNMGTAGNGCDAQHYCAYALLESGRWFIASERGTRDVGYNPTLPASPNAGQCPCLVSE